MEGAGADANLGILAEPSLAPARDRAAPAPPTSDVPVAAVGPTEVTIQAFTFTDADPLRAGQEVLVTNNDSVPHALTADDGSFDTGLLLPGEQAVITAPAGLSACDGGCANAWPPILVPSAQLPADLDPALFSVIQRADGTNQLKAGKWPLYLFAGDTAAGQTTGHLSGDVWFAVSPNGALIDASGSDTAEAAIDSASSEFGEILVDKQARTCAVRIHK